MKLENLLQLLIASNSDEIRLEPDKKPYFVAPDGNHSAQASIVNSTLISQMIFPAIPLEEKLRLPNLPQISFQLNNEMGVFAVTVAKSPVGLNVIVKKITVYNSALNAVQNAAPKEIVSDAAAAPPVSLAIDNIAPPVPAPPAAAEPAKSENVKPKSFFGSLQQAFSTGVKTVEPNDHAAENSARLDVKIIAPEAAAPPAAVIEPPPIAPLNVELPLIALPVDSDVSQISAPPVVPEKAEVMYAQTNGVARQKMDLLFHKMAEAKASDLHLSVSMSPMMRMDGKMAVLDEAYETLTPAAMRELLWSIMPEKNREEFERRHDTDFAYEIKDLARFRANIFMDRKGMGGVFRIIPTKILTAEQLGLSKAILDLCSLSKGLVVVTGPTGSGKSTTLCAMIDYVNKQREDHIITIEDPIEFVHENQQCLINQREVHNHTDSFKDALRAALREDPDILLVGEMRDLETISIAIETAETGHLVFGTLHTTTAPSTVDRIIDQFPADRQQQIRVMLSESLRGVIAQTLLPKKGGGRVAALEILIVTPAISNLIREGKTFQIASAMQTGKATGMVVLNDALVDLVRKGIVEPRDAYIKAVDKTGFELALKRHNLSL